MDRESRGKKMSSLSNNMGCVTVILSTYNGQEHIVEQMNSLISQRDVRLKLFVRDDGSSDETVRIIESYRDKFEYLQIVCEKNIGATESFYRAAELTKNSPLFDTEYYAFCDQDDIWLESKLITGIENLKKYDKNKPNLYFSNLMMVDNNNNAMGMLIDDTYVSCSRYNALASICTYGCTCIFNRAALEAFCNIKESRKFIYHDNWMYSVCAFLGNTYYDSGSNIRYRQTGSNVSGIKREGIALWCYRLKKILNLKKDNHLYESIAAELIDDFKYELDKEDIIFLTRMTQYRNKIGDKMHLLFTKRLKTKSISKNICIMGRILLNAL